MPARRPHTPSRRTAPRRRRRERRGLLAALGGTAAILLLAAVYLVLLGAPPAAPDPLGGPFRLQASDGRTVTERSFPGRTLLLYFGYTHCRDVCPTTLSTLALALDGLGPEGKRVQPLFVSVDPARDSPSVLRRYLAAISPRLLGATGTEAEVTAMLRAFRVSRSVVPDGHGGTDIAHGSVLYVLAQDGGVAGLIPADASAAAMRAALARLI